MILFIYLSVLKDITKNQNDPNIWKSRVRRIIIFIGALMPDYMTKGGLARVVFRAIANIYDEAFLRKRVLVAKKSPKPPF